MKSEKARYFSWLNYFQWIYGIGIKVEVEKKKNENLNIIAFQLTEKKKKNTDKNCHLQKWEEIYLINKEQKSNTWMSETTFYEL